MDLIKKIFLDEEIEGIQRYRVLLDYLDFEAISITLLELCLLELMMPNIKAILMEVKGFYGMSFEFACKVADAFEEIQLDYYSEAKKQFQKLTTLLISPQSNELLFSHVLRADKRLYSFIAQDDDIDENIKNVARLDFCTDLVDVFIGENKVSEITKNLQDFIAPDSILQITGEDGVGKRLLLSEACRRIGRAVIYVDWSKLSDCDSDKISEIMRYIKRESVFYGMAIAFHSLINQDFENIKNTEKFIEVAIKSLDGSNIKIILITQPLVRIYPHFNGNVSKIDFKAHTRNDRIVFWEKFCENYKLKTKLDCVAYASNFILTPKEIDKVIGALLHQENLGMEITSAVVAQACYNSIKSSSQGNVKRITTDFTLDDIKLPEVQKQALRSLCNHVTYRHLVYDTWGMESKYQYGRSVSALFTGPPGTGKTMAVHIISSMINMQLYRIDLSQVVDKYIGETEKRLEEIFNTAQKSNVILFFDEADAIFGKRSEVNDAKDKYANTETSYILQKIEDYDGIVILATNYKKNIDEAFMRRIRYMVDFPLPNAKIREEIWRGAFTKQIPLLDVDFPYLASQFEFSGGSIKNIVLNSAFVAAGDNTPITMDCILSCIRRENLKMGKTMIANDFGQYSHLFDK